MLSRIYTALGLAALIAGLVLGTLYYRSQAKLTKAKADLDVAQETVKVLARAVVESEKARKADRVGLETKAKLTDKRNVQKDATKKELNNAIQAAPDWAAEPLPDGVLSALAKGRQRAREGVSP